MPAPRNLGTWICFIGCSLADHQHLVLSDGQPMMHTRLRTEPSRHGTPIDSSQAAQQIRSFLPNLEEMDQLLRSLLGSWSDNSHVLVTRQWHRLPYEHDIVVTPLCDETRQPIFDSFRTAGCDLSQGGISFEHPAALPCRYVAATFDVHDNQQCTVEVKLAWCRFTCEGVYRSGGKFLRSLPMPDDVFDAWER